MSTRTVYAMYSPKNVFKSELFRKIDNDFKGAIDKWPDVSLGVSVENIFMGVLISIADRAATLLKRVKLDEDIYLTGGLVHLPAMAKALEKVMDYQVHALPDAHYAAAIGAAKLGHQRAMKKIAA